jgi:serine/threonine protein kinase/Tol biopolymer transport system component
MALAPDVRIGQYQITVQIGAGGMGEVYRARDTTLERDVAIKVLPEAFAQDPERLARFEREARTLAALNHPNIAQIYGLERSGSITALVMELVEGETLAANGAIPLDEALSLATQIGAALEVAHEQGIIHRDLKPANIKVRSDGTVKVLDFGLAKALEPASVAGSTQADQAYAMSQSPTLTFQATQAGLILGTAAYMSPEQARGKPADKRADIWSFGVVLFEMLSGHRVFEGEDVSETLAFVLTKTPDWSKLPATTPPAIVTLLRRCLERDRRRRVADMSTVRFVIEEAASLVVVRPEVDAPPKPPATVRPLWRRLVPVMSAIALTAAIAGLGAWAVWPRSAAPVSRFAIIPPSDQHLSGIGRRVLALSRDGTLLVYVANNRMFLRPMASLEPSPIGEGGVGNITEPVFSPDGRSIAFVAGAESAVKQIAVSGGVASSTVCGFQNAPMGMWWDASGIILGNGARGILRCPPNGGSSQQLIPATATEWLAWPQLLPDGDTLLFAAGKPEAFIVYASASDETTIVTQSLRSGKRTTVMRNASAPRYVETGHLLYTQRGIVFAAPFDPAHPTEIGGGVPVIEGVRRFPGAGFTPQYDISDNGSLVFIPGPARYGTGQVMLIATDRTGKFERVLPDARSYEHPRVTRDGKYVVYSTVDGQDANIWVYEIGSPSAPRRLTTFGGRNVLPIWSGDGSRVAYQSNKEGDLAIFAQRFDGTDRAERLTKPARDVSHVPESWSPDGQFLTFDEVKGTSHTLWILSLADKKVMATGVQSIEPFESSFSPDGKWLAYYMRRTDTQSADRGTYVQRFPLTGLPQQAPKVNVDFHPVWTLGGKGLLYVGAAASNLFAEVTVATSPTLTFGSAMTFASPVQDRVSVERRDFDILPDGRFIGVAGIDRAETSAQPAAEMRVVLNWFEELKARVPIK